MKYVGQVTEEALYYLREPGAIRSYLHWKFGR